MQQQDILLPHNNLDLNSTLEVGDLDSWSLPGTHKVFQSFLAQMLLTSC